MEPDRGTILPLDQAAAATTAARGRGERVVLCHGCFDLVHPGHVRHLRQAARLGDRLVVSVTGDASVAKGVDRPLIPQELRAENLAALAFVDWVVIAPGPTGLEVIESLQPDIYVKGREYETNRDPRFAAERAAVEHGGGRVVFTSGDVVFSSTALIGSVVEDVADPSHAALRRLVHDAGLGGGAADDLVASFRGRRVLVAGETIVDTYVACDRPDVAGEAPMLSLRPIGESRFDGGAAIIARHLLAMGAQPVLLTALPRTVEAETLRLRLDAEGVETVSVDVDGPLLEKRRFLVGETKMVKLDLGEPVVLDAAERDVVVDRAAELAADCDAVILADFGQGFWTERQLERACERIRPHVDVLAGDVSGARSNLLGFRDADLLAPSEVELRRALHDHSEGLSAVVARLLARTRSAAAVVTMGPEGLLCFAEPSAGHVGDRGWDDRLRTTHVPALVRHAVDPLGCGDALLAATVLARASGASLDAAMITGAVAAAAEARQLGNAVIGAAELRRGLARLAGARLVFDAPALTVPGERRPAAEAGA